MMLTINRSSVIDVHKDDIYSALLKKRNNISLSRRTISKLIKISNITLGLSMENAYAIFSLRKNVAQRHPVNELLQELVRVKNIISNDFMIREIDRWISNCTGIIDATSDGCLSPLGVNNDLSKLFEEGNYTPKNKMHLNEVLKDDLIKYFYELKPLCKNYTIGSENIFSLMYDCGEQCYKFTNNKDGDTFKIYVGKENFVVRITFSGADGRNLLTLMKYSLFLKREFIKGLSLASEGKTWCHSVPRNLHYIWLGDNPIHKSGVGNIINALTLNPESQCYLWTDNPQKLKHRLLESGYSSKLLEKINILKPELDKTLEVIVARECTENGFGNKAAASDIIRIAMLQKFGGVYMDMDVAIREKIFPVTPIEINDEVDCLWLAGYLFYSEPCSEPCSELMRFVHGFYNAVMAAAKGSKLLAKMLEEIKETYDHQPSERNVNKFKTSPYLSSKFKEKFKSEGIAWAQKRATVEGRLRLTMCATGPNFLLSIVTAMGRNEQAFIMDNADVFGHMNRPLDGWKATLDSGGSYFDKSNWRSTLNQVVSEV